MVKPAWLFDGRRVVDPKKLEAIGLNVYVVGNPHTNKMVRACTGRI